MMLAKKGINSNGKYIEIAGHPIYYTVSQNGLERYISIKSFSIKLPKCWSMAGINREYRKKRQLYHKRQLFQTDEQIETRLASEYRLKLGRTPNLKQPQLLTEKINWLKLHYKNPLITTCCDKFRLKEYVSQQLDTDAHNVLVLGLWECAWDISFEGLPKSFVLKVNWSSGYNIFVKDKYALSVADKQRILKQLDIWTRPESNSYFDSFNWGYKNMRPVIYAEEYLPREFTATEYKFFVFNGRVEFVLLELTDIYNIAHRVCVDRQSNKTVFTFGNQSVAGEYNISPQFQEMLKTSEVLAAPFPFVRVDFFANIDRYYIGEMTFYSGGGFSKVTPDEWDERLGSLLNLDN